ncbi:MAG: four helix bundle protein [Rhodothermales bacterium]
MAIIRHHKELKVYNAAFDAAMLLFEMTKSWPRDERYSMIDQIRRSSRSVCANISEGWRRRHFPKHFKAKMIDADSEASETRTWLEFAQHCGYIDENQFTELNNRYDEVNKMLWSMITNSRSWTPRMPSQP